MTINSKGLFFTDLLAAEPALIPAFSRCFPSARGWSCAWTTSYTPPLRKPNRLPTKQKPKPQEAIYNEQ